MSENNVQNEQELWDLLSDSGSAEHAKKAPKSSEGRFAKPGPMKEVPPVKEGRKLDGFFFACMAGVAAVSVAATLLIGGMTGGGGMGNIFMKAVGAMLRGESPQDFMRGLANTEPKLRGLDCSKEAALLAERLGLDTTRKIEQLSFGNRKKVGIVAALQHKPRLYILDEPTSGLDPLAQKEFYSILEERNKEGATVFLSSHVLPEIARYCKHAAVIREGRILVSDSVSNLAYTGIKRVTLRGITEMPEIKGARNLKQGKNAIQFLYGGTAAELITLLSTLSFTDFSVADPELDEIFLHYYAKEENANGTFLA